MIVIELANPDAEAFAQFQKYHDQFVVLLEKGFFEIKSGSGTAHFDAGGKIRKVEVSTLITKI